jgi:hypothetical protein
MMKKVSILNRQYQSKMISISFKVRIIAQSLNKMSIKIIIRLHRKVFGVLRKQIVILNLHLLLFASPIIM